MPESPCPQVIRVTFYSTYLGETHINRIHFANILGLPSSLEIAQLTEWAANVYSEQVVSQLHQQFAFIRTTAEDLSGPDGYYYETTSGATVGGLTGDAEPGNVALFVKFSNGRVGRGGHGGVSISGAIAENVTGNTFAIDWADGVRDGLSTFLEVGAEVPNYVMALVNRYVLGLQINPANWSQIVSISLTDLNVDSRRSRLKGRGK